MSVNDAQPDREITAGSGVKDLALDLAFVPQWARQPPGRNPYARFEDSGERPRKGRERGGPGRGGRPPRGEKTGGGPARGPRDRGRPSGDGKPPRRRMPGERAPARSERGRPGGRAPRPVVDLPPVDIHFIPERERLGTLVRELHQSQRAYRLGEIANLFLSRPEHHAVKVEIRKNDPASKDLKLYHCKATHALFLSRASAYAHVQRECLDEFYEVQEVEREPPAGNFVVIARCGLSGELLGPPNHHSYADRVAELHRERFSNMSLEAYRSKIQVLRDPELIEQWKESLRHHKVYREKQAGENAVDMDREAAEAHFREHHAPDLVMEGSRFVVPSSALSNVEDMKLRAALREAWTRETRRPFTILRALRPALRHLRLHIFRANGKTPFATAVHPHPIAPGQTIETIGEALTYLQEHPGCTRQQMLNDLRPGKDPASKEAAEVLTPLRWLVERGHVIEFYNGTLAVPRSSTAASSGGPR